MFPGIGALPEPATGSHVVNKGTPVAPCRLKAQRKRVTRVGSPRSPVFPLANIMSCLRSPITQAWGEPQYLETFRAGADPGIIPVEKETTEGETLLKEKQQQERPC
jgi:hypothetical protein